MCIFFRPNYKIFKLKKEKSRRKTIKDHFAKFIKFKKLVATKYLGPNGSAVLTFIRYNKTKWQ